jgi:hypothetical protein
MILADNVYADRTTGKKVIAGTYDTIWAEGFPATFTPVSRVFVSLTSIKAPLHLALQFRNAKTQEILLDTKKSLEVNAESPFDTVEVVLELPSLLLPAEGVYSLDLMSDGEMLGSIRIKAARRAAKGEGT